MSVMLIYPTIPSLTLDKFFFSFLKWQIGG